MDRLRAPPKTERERLFEQAFCGDAFQVQVAARASLKAGDRVAVMTLHGCEAIVRTATVAHATPKYLTVNGVKYRRHNGKAVHARTLARVTFFVSAITPAVRAWMDCKGEENESIL